jgi:GMP synthase PP-ATPase subunit
VDDAIEKGRRGYDTRAEVVKDALRRFLEQLESEQRMEHVNVYEEHVTVRDNVLNRTIIVYLRDGTMTCDLCESNDCLHTRYVQTLPQVKEKMVELRESN